MKIALDPTLFHHDYELLEFPWVVVDLGYDYLQLTPHRECPVSDQLPLSFEPSLAPRPPRCSSASRPPE
jgi:myo-inositol catabolism protein IolH